MAKYLANDVAVLVSGNQVVVIGTMRCCASVAMMIGEIILIDYSGSMAMSGVRKSGMLHLWSSVVKNQIGCCNEDIRSTNMESDVTRIYALVFLIACVFGSSLPELGNFVAHWLRLSDAHYFNKYFLVAGFVGIVLCCFALLS